MELEIFHHCHLCQQTTTVWHCRIPAGPGLVQADNGITRVYTGVPAKGSATGWVAGKRVPLAFTAPHSRHSPSSKITPGLISTVPTTLHLCFSISSYMACH